LNLQLNWLLQVALYYYHQSSYRFLFKYTSRFVPRSKIIAGTFLIKWIPLPLIFRLNLVVQSSKKTYQLPLILNF
jgi:hypothetical protein